MFLLQLQLYVLTIIRVTLRRIQKPFRRKSTFCKFCKYTILSKLRVQRKSVLQALFSDCSEWAIHGSIVLARIDFVSLYFRLLWYYSILRGSIDQKHAKGLVKKYRVGRGGIVLKQRGDGSWGFEPCARGVSCNFQLPLVGWVTLFYYIDSH